MVSAFENADFTINDKAILLGILDNNSVVHKIANRTEFTNPTYSDMLIDSYKMRRNAIYLKNIFQKPKQICISESENFAQALNDAGSFEKSTPIKIEIDIVSKSFWDYLGLPLDVGVTQGYRWSFDMSLLAKNLEKLKNKGIFFIFL